MTSNNIIAGDRTGHVLFHFRENNFLSRCDKSAVLLDISIEIVNAIQTNFRFHGFQKSEEPTQPDCEIWEARFDEPIGLSTCDTQSNPHNRARVKRLRLIKNPRSYRYSCYPIKEDDSYEHRVSVL